MDDGLAKENSKFMEPVALKPSRFALVDDKAKADAECGSEEEWDESLFQFEADRFGRLMASRPGLSAAAARSASATRGTLMRINVRADAQLIIGQYKTFTLAVLTRCMQNVHRSVLGNSDGPKTPEEKDEKYWEICSWKIMETSGASISGRFRNPVSKGIKKYPYSFVGRDGGKELNPDLSSRWVQEFLEKQGAWGAIEAALGKHNTTLGNLGLRDRYGVLIAPFWEELSDAELGEMEEQMTAEVNQEYDTDLTTDTTTHEDSKLVHVSKRRD
ncbi:hypothetical protein F5Y19DRAFT_465442 [Xylariaceae sp. FL1651]|nr:hypothetical protein F5Y19DRAFT_465442 [Xylariaceae sp. FL1651]